MTTTWHRLSTWRGAWRGGPGQLLALYVTLDAAAAVLVALSHLPLPQRAQPLAFPVAAFFAWRVSRGGLSERYPDHPNGQAAPKPGGGVA